MKTEDISLDSIYDFINVHLMCCYIMPLLNRRMSYHPDEFDVVTYIKKLFITKYTLHWT